MIKTTLTAKNVTTTATNNIVRAINNKTNLYIHGKGIYSWDNEKDAVAKIKRSSNELIESINISDDALAKHARALNDALVTLMD